MPAWLMDGILHPKSSPAPRQIGQSMRAEPWLREGRHVLAIRFQGECCRETTTGGAHPVRPAAGLARYASLFTEDDDVPAVLLLVTGTE